MSRQFTVQSIREFGSLTTASNASVIPDNALTQLKNFDFTQEKTLIKRRGMQVLSWDYPSQLNTMAATQPDGVLWVIGKFSKHTGGSSDDYVVFTDGAKVWYTTYSGYSAVELTVGGAAIANAKYAVQGNDGDLYIITTSTIRKWDPAAAANAVSAQASRAGTKAVWFKERLFVIYTEGTGADPSTCWYSKIADVSAGTGFPAANSFLVGGEDGQYNIDLIVFNDQLFIFKNRSVYVLSADGDPSTWVLRQLHPYLGAAGKNTAVVIEGLLYYLSNEGVYRTDGVTFDEISAPIKDQIGGYSYTYVDGASISAVLYNDKYVLNRPLVGNDMLVYDTYTEQWTSWDFPAAIQPYGMIVMYSGSAERLVVGNSDVNHNTLWYMTPDNYDYDPTTYPLYRDWETDRKSTRLNSSH